MSNIYQSQKMQQHVGVQFNKPARKPEVKEEVAAVIAQPAAEQTLAPATLARKAA